MPPTKILKTIIKPTKNQSLFLLFYCHSVLVILNNGSDKILYLLGLTTSMANSHHFGAPVGMASRNQTVDENK